MLPSCECLVWGIIPNNKSHKIQGDKIYNGNGKKYFKPEPYLILKKKKTGPNPLSLQKRRYKVPDTDDYSNHINCLTRGQTVCQILYFTNICSEDLGDNLLCDRLTDFTSAKMLAFCTASFTGLNLARSSCLCNDTWQNMFCIAASAPCSSKFYLFLPSSCFGHH